VSEQNSIPSEQAVDSRWVPVSVPQVRPVVTYTLMGLTVAVYVLQLATKFIMGVDYPALLGLKDNDSILLGQLWRLVTPMFLHDSRSILHIGFNMYALYILGPTLERYYKHGRFLLLYFLSGFAGNVISFLFSPELSLGASTAIFGLIGAQGVFFYRNRQIFGRMAQRALMNILTVAVINLIIGLSPGIDNWGHLGGLLGGTLFAWLGGPLLRVEQEMGAYKLSDNRQTETVLAAGAGVGILFALLAALKIIIG
jgi:rhomboid protease GluP